MATMSVPREGRAAMSPLGQQWHAARELAWMELGSSGAQGMKQSQKQQSQDRKPAWFSTHFSFRQFLVWGYSAV